MSSNSSKLPKYHKKFPNQPLYDTVPTQPLSKNHDLIFVKDFVRPNTSNPVTTSLLNKATDTKDTNCKCCFPFRPRRKKLSKSSKKVGKKSNKKSGKVRKNKRKTTL